MTSNFSTLHFGTAGMPSSTNKTSGFNTANGIRRVKELGLGCMELEFVRSVNISKERAPEVRNAAQETGVALTCHGQYFINLNSIDAAKQKASVERVLNAARIASLCGAWSMCFHAGFFLGQEPAKVHEKIKKTMKDIVATLKDEGHTLWIRPETTGKPTQFGSIYELVQLSTELEQVLPCIDFAHLHAREGKLNTRSEWEEVLALIEKKLGKEALKQMHIHLNGIVYGPKGEKHHVNLDDPASDFKYKELLGVLKEYKVAGTVTCESPDTQGDALILKNTYEKC
ncbi:MAG: TIM barrel protein [Candidatus Woesearchaeota archaeon]|nr:TIM barrel protein [Candidatus Woesearchaeota archaeon]